MGIQSAQKSNNYEDIVNLLHSNQNDLIIVNNVKISVFDIAHIYESVKMGDNVIEKIIAAHDKVLSYGLNQGKETILAIDLATGATIAESYGTEHSVDWQLDDNFQGKVVTIHNHSSNATFSPTDLFTFSTEKRVYMSVIQCHNGKIFSLSKTTEQYKPLSKETLESQLFDDFKNSGIKKSSDSKINYILDKYVYNLQKQNNWLYKRSDSNGKQNIN